MAQSKRKTITLILVIIAGVITSFLLYAHPFKKIDLESKIDQLNRDEEEFLHSLNSNDWDSVFIIGPYNTEGIQLVDMSGKYKRSIQTIISYDTNCVLLFIKKNKLVNYAIIPRSPYTDFAEYNNLYFDRNCKLRVNSEGVVHLIK